MVVVGKQTCQVPGVGGFDALRCGKAPATVDSFVWRLFFLLRHGLAFCKAPSKTRRLLPASYQRKRWCPRPVLRQIQTSTNAVPPSRSPLRNVSSKAIGMLAADVLP